MDFSGIFFLVLANVIMTGFIFFNLGRKEDLKHVPVKNRDADKRNL